MTLRRILAVLPTNGHGGCEYNALSALKYLRERHDFDVRVSFPVIEETAYLSELCQANKIEVLPLQTTFRQTDDKAAVEKQRAATRDVVREVAPWAVFIPMPWPKRGQGVIAGCADTGVPTVVKFALVPPDWSADSFVYAAAKAALHQRQVWFANSQFSAALIERHWRLPARSVDSFHVGPIGLSHLLPDRVAFETRDQIRADVRLEFGWPRECRIVTTVARLSNQKGYDSLMSAVLHVAAAHEDLRFLWVGHGELENEIAIWRQNFGLEHKIATPGFRDDVRRLLKASDLFVLPTLYEGGCSQALLEAMEEGLPIVVTDTSAVSEVARHERNALVVPLRDAEKLAEAIDALVGDPERATTLGKAAMADVVEFSAERSFEETLGRLRRAASVTGLEMTTDDGQTGALQAVSAVESSHYLADDPSFASGWYAVERQPDGMAFRWMTGRGVLYTNLLLDAPALVQVSLLAAISPQALQTISLTVNGQKAELVDASDLKLTWKSSPVRSNNAARILLSAQTTRPIDLDPASSDNRELSIAVCGMEIRSAL